MIDNEMITVAGIPIKVARKQRQKNLYIRVNPPEGDVTVSAPVDVTEDAIRYYVLRKVPEITKIRDRMIAQPRQSKREYVSGEACYLWGKPYMLQVIYEGKRYRIEKTPQRIIMHAPEGASEENREKALTEWYRGELKRACQGDGSLDTLFLLCYGWREVKNMPRMPRKPSGSGYYHVVSRGIGKQVLFEETEDYERYLETLRRFLPENSISLIAYCLMENHVHLLVHAESGLERAMKQIAVSYSYYFNAKYDRVGHLFQDRYMSEPVEDERYLLAAVRYIHNNPPKAGICPRDEYRWSSWREYMGAPDLVATELVLELVGGVERFVPFSEGDVREPFLDATEKRRLTDSQAIDLIRAELHLKSGTQVQSMSKAERDEALRVMKERGISVRQIERLTGINRGAIQRA